MSTKKEAVQAAAAELQATAEMIDNLVGDLIQNANIIITKSQVESMHVIASGCRVEASRALLAMAEEENPHITNRDIPF